MLNDFEKKVADFIRQQGLFSSVEKVLLAISGGADSTALVYVMSALKSEDVISTDLCCAHINHQLRGDEAQKDEDYVIEQCRKLGIPLITKKINVKAVACEKKLSIETAARDLRITTLSQIAKEQNCSCIATAHQKNDNAETIIQRLARGTGYRGLCGIWPKKQFDKNIIFIRPLLCVARDEIIKYLKDHNVEWCHDKTNDYLIYKRNFIRHKLLPYLQNDCNRPLVDELFELADVSRKYEKIISASAEAVWTKVAVLENQNAILKASLFEAQLPEVKVQIIRRGFAHLGFGEQDLTKKHYEKIINLLDNSAIQVPGRIKISRQGGKIIFSPPESKDEDAFVPPEHLNIPGQIDYSSFKLKCEIIDFSEVAFEEFKKNKDNYIEWFALDKIKLPVIVRFRKQGDKFRPLGLPGEKRVGKFLTNVKVSQALKEKLLIISDAVKIIWLCPVRVSESAKITKQTKRVLQITVTK